MREQARLTYRMGLLLLGDLTNALEMSVPARVETRLTAADLPALRGPVERGRRAQARPGRIPRALAHQSAVRRVSPRDVAVALDHASSLDSARRRRDAKYWPGEHASRAGDQTRGEGSGRIAPNNARLH